VHRQDAERYGLSDGALALVRSRRGELAARVQVSERIRAGTVFLPMHWGAAQADPCEANRLMHELGCPLSGQPELKAAAVCLAPGPEAGAESESESAQLSATASTASHH
jgi:ferredoxin-nitrate reductase